MHPGMMRLTAAAITAERVAPSGARVARLAGALAMAAGLILCMQAL